MKSGFALAALGVTALALWVTFGSKTLGTVASLFVRDDVTVADFQKGAELLEVNYLKTSGPIALALSHFARNLAAEHEGRVSLEVAPGWITSQAMGPVAGLEALPWDTRIRVERVCENDSPFPGVIAEADGDAGSPSYSSPEALRLTYENGRFFTYYKREVLEGERASLGLLKDGRDKKAALLAAFPGLLAPCPEVASAQSFEDTFQIVPQSLAVRAWGQDRSGQVGLPTARIPDAPGQESFFISKSNDQVQFEMVWDFKQVKDARIRFDELEAALQKLAAPSRVRYVKGDGNRWFQKEVIRRFETGQVFTSLLNERQGSRVRLAWAAPDVVGFEMPNVPPLSLADRPSLPPSLPKQPSHPNKH